MEPLTVAQRIIKIIEALKEEGKKLQDFVDSHELPQAEVNYQKAKQTMCAIMKADGKTIGEIDKEIKGRCSKELLAREIAQIQFKAINTRIGILKAQMLGYQSVNKHLAEAP